MPENRKRDLEICLSEERTILSKERTILSFIQTGLAFIGMGIVIINFVGVTNYPSQVVGWALILIGFVEVLESYRRLRRYQKKMDKIKTKLGKKGI
jgi:uncharacterized membrane protein YidH (DUF202 family)